MDLNIRRLYAKPDLANFDNLARLLCYIAIQLGDRALRLTIEMDDCSRLLQEQSALRKLLLDISYKLVRRWSKDSSLSTPITC